MLKAGLLLLLLRSGLARAQEVQEAEPSPENALSVLCESQPTANTYCYPQSSTTSSRSVVTSIAFSTVVAPPPPPPTTTLFVAASPRVAAPGPWPSAPNKSPGDLWCGTYAGWKGGDAFDLDAAKARNDAFCGESTR